MWSPSLNIAINLILTYITNESGVNCIHIANAPYLTSADNYEKFNP